MRSGLVLFVCMVLAPVWALALDMHEPQVVDVAKKAPGYQPDTSYVTLRMPDNIPLQYWVVCDYHSYKKGLVASTNHVLLKRMQGWIVDVPVGDVDYAICWVQR